jgi:competence ComEA-like helix-hairpin-helix protein
MTDRNPDGLSDESALRDLSSRREVWSERNVLAVILAALFLFFVLEIWVSRRHSAAIVIDRKAEKQQGYRIDVNQATVYELIHLPDIGPALAERIVQYRDQHGPFRALEDLRQVGGIGPQTLKSMAPYLRWTSPSAPEGQTPSESP